MICPPEYVKSISALLPCLDDSNWNIKSTTVRKYNANPHVSLTCATSLLPRNFGRFLRFDRDLSSGIC
ncbi:uncharacterized protein G2W53_021985 [Senna tora]|uniref:Uncharacterized protein n=1 Tax=Senna tora TaxID=362788 RepID=A0A834TMW8_9FABA|nr:uncharacterized protein G2W53_021985 [Senna tora]